MINFDKRSNEKELLDGNNIPFGDIKRNMQELDKINHLLGGHKITISGLKKLIYSTPTINKISIVEIGCGGGDNLRVIKNWCLKKDIIVELTGVDINAECIQFAKSQDRNNVIKFICSDYRDVKFESQPHIIFSSLFCHHFTNEELIQMMKWKCNNVQIGFFINDLHRHPLAYYSIKYLAKVFSKSYLVKNDAPLSVQRSFKKEDWELIFKNAGIKDFECEWKWAFRWLVTCCK